jgi:1-acyl-sn-glycerol-3-phosphate acyltransferase
VTIALQSGAPLLPIAYYGNERFRHNIKRLQRTDFRIVVGSPFIIDSRGVKVTRQVRQQMADEIMYQLAGLLPPAYRGYYADISRVKQTYLKFVTDLPNNHTKE